MECQSLVQCNMQELVWAALPLQQGSAVRGGPQWPSTWQGGLGRAGTCTPTKICAWACMDRPGGRVWTDLSRFALYTVFFILRGPMPAAENVFHVRTGYSGHSPEVPTAEEQAQPASDRRKGLWNHGGSSLVMVP